MIYVWNCFEETLKFYFLSFIDIEMVHVVHILSHRRRSHVLNHGNKILLTHWGRATHICVGKLTIIGSDNGLSPARRQAIIWTIAGILLIGPLGTNFSEILIRIQTFSFTKMQLKVSSAKWRTFCLGLNVYQLLVVVFFRLLIHITFKHTCRMKLLNPIPLKTHQVYRTLTLYWAAPQTSRMLPMTAEH